MSLPPVEEINNRWIELEKKVAGNPSDNGERLLSAPYNSDTFLPYIRPLMKFYRSTSSDFTTIAPKCQDSFKSVCSKPFTTPPTISLDSDSHPSNPTFSKFWVFNTWHWLPKLKWGLTGFFSCRAACAVMRIHSGMNKNIYFKNIFVWLYCLLPPMRKH